MDGLTYIQIITYLEIYVFETCVAAVFIVGISVFTWLEIRRWLKKLDARAGRHED